MPDLARDAAGRIFWSRLESDAVTFDGPNHSCGIHDEFASHSGTCVAYFEVLASVRPVHLEGNRGRIILPVLERVYHVEVIFHLEILNCQGSSARARIHKDAVRADRNRPEKPVVQTWIKVVDLIAEIGSLRPHVEVDSNKGEVALMVPSIPPDVFAGHEAHIRIEDQGCVRRRCEAFGSPTAKNIGGAHRAVEISDGGKFGRRSGQEHMENMSIAEEVQPPGNGIGQRRFLRGTERERKGEACRERRARLQEITARKRGGASPEMGVTARAGAAFKQVLRYRN